MVVRNLFPVRPRVKKWRIHDSRVIVSGANNVREKFSKVALANVTSFNAVIIVTHFRV